MACKTPSVERVVSKTAKAKKQIEELQSMIEAQKEANKKKFFAQMDEHLKSAEISDAREIGYSSDIKTEYTSEFSLDKIAGVITSSLLALKEVTSPSITSPAMSPAAIDAYVDVVNTVAEAAKSSSTAAASISFSMSRLSPGMFAFLFAFSVSIQDDETFGVEAVTSTAIYYRFIQSIQDLKQQGAFDAAKIEIALNLETYKKFKALQVSIIDDLGNGKIDIDTYTKLDDFYGKKAAEVKAKLDEVKAGPDRLLLGAKEAREAQFHQELVRSSLQKLSSRGEAFGSVIEKAQKRIETGYF